MQPATTASTSARRCAACASAVFARILTEGGPSLLGRLAADDLIDEVVATTSADCSSAATPVAWSSVRRGRCAA